MKKLKSKVTLKGTKKDGYVLTVIEGKKKWLDQWLTHEELLELKKLLAKVK